jgi:ankyrin repeat protein
MWVYVGEKGYEEIVEYLIAQGADMTIQTDWGYTALTASMVECEGLGNIRNELIITLIESGVDVNAKTRKISPLIAASGNGNVEIVSKLIEKGAKVNWKTSKMGEFPLLYAAWSGHLEVVKILIESGAKVHWKNHYGETALSIARKEGYKEIEKMLIDAGAK